MIPLAELLASNETPGADLRKPQQMSACFLRSRLAHVEFERIYSRQMREQVETELQTPVPVIEAEVFRSSKVDKRGCEILLGTWGMPRLDASLLDAMPSLKAVFYAAGTVKNFVSQALWERGVVVSSEWSANAVSVAEYATAAILLGLKQVFPLSRRVKAGRRWERAPIPGTYGSRVGLVSLGTTGGRVAALLQRHDVEVVAFDPFVPGDRAKSLGVRLVELDELFSTCAAISVHAPLLPETQHLIGSGLLRLMPPQTTFINTARGAIVDEAALIQVLSEREDITAILDVTDPEPPEPGSPLFELPNVVLTPHIAGCTENECGRLGSLMIDEFRRWRKGEPLLHRVDHRQLASMA